MIFLIIAGILLWLYGIRATFRWLVEGDYLDRNVVPGGEAIALMLLLSLLGSPIGLVTLPFRVVEGRGDEDMRLRLVKTIGGESRKMRMRRLEQEATAAKMRTAELERELKI